MVRAIRAGQAIHLRRPAALRPWQHVLEPLSGYILLGSALAENRIAAASAWNFGPIDAEPLMVRDIAHQFVKTWGRGLVTEETQESGPHEAHFLKLDSSKAVSQLGWQPLLSPLERVRWTVDWYKAGQDRPESIWDDTRRQIQLAEAKIELLKSFTKAWNGETVPARSRAA
jgi:CDP-glucose 4,6-dehydratase